MYKIAIGILFIIGGLSGGMVLRGTESGIALAVVGLVFCIWGGVQFMSDRKSAQPRVRRAPPARRKGAPPRKPLAPPAPPGNRRPPTAGQ